MVCDYIFKGCQSFLKSLRFWLNYSRRKLPDWCGSWERYNGGIYQLVVHEALCMSAHWIWLEESLGNGYMDSPPKHLDIASSESQGKRASSSQAHSMQFNKAETTEWWLLFTGCCWTTLDMCQAQCLCFPDLLLYFAKLSAATSLVSLCWAQQREPEVDSGLYQTE